MSAVARLNRMGWVDCAFAAWLVITSHYVQRDPRFECQVLQLAALIGLFRVGGLVFQDKAFEQKRPKQRQRPAPAPISCHLPRGRLSGAATLLQTKFPLPIYQPICHLVLPERCWAFTRLQYRRGIQPSQLRDQARQTALTRPPCRKPVLEITKTELTLVLSKPAGQY